MQGGRLRHRLTIQEPIDTRNHLNELVRTWSTWATVYGAVEPLRGQEFFDAEQVQGELWHRVRVRYREGYTTHMRILHLDRVLQIQAVIDVEERHREMQLMCRETPDAP